MLRLAVALLVFVGAATVSARPAPVTDGHPKVELVTIGIGALAWERHGHIAICVTENGLRSSIVHDAPGDRCFNYGNADFEHPLTMASGFVRGTHSFWVTQDLPWQLWHHYRVTDRTIWAQELPLDAAQKTKLIAKLEDDVVEAHRYYAYDHFNDNCTTRIRDILDDVTDHSLSKMTEPAGDKTYRDYARDGFYGMRVPLIVADTIMGRSTDRVPTYWERMFLPQYLREAVETQWGVHPTVVYERKECIGHSEPSCVARGVPAVKDPGSGRWALALVIVVLTAPVWLSRWLGKFQRTGLAISVVPYWLFGVALTALAIISPLRYFRINELILVWFPLDLAILFLSRECKVKYARARVVMLAVIAVLLLVGVLRQPLWAPMLWPLIPMATVAFRD
ncbi:MAG: DUF4105 domain-containing protein [Kofleriaceae bacterium]